MTLTKETLPQLVRLQAQDKVLDALKSSIDGIPADIQAVRGALDAAKARVTEIRGRATQLQLQKKGKEIELAQKEEAVRKHSTELNQVKTNEAYKALQSEIDRAKAEASDLETAILTLMEEIDRAAQEEKDAAARLKEEEARATERVAELESRQAELAARADHERAQRDGLSAGIPADVLKLYDYLRKRKQGVAMAPVAGNICGACRISLRPQVLVELAKGVELVSCDACQRILYQPEAAGAASGAAGAEGAAPAG